MNYTTMNKTNYPASPTEKQYKVSTKSSITHQRIKMSKDFLIANLAFFTQHFFIPDGTFFLSLRTAKQEAIQKKHKAQVWINSVEFRSASVASSLRSSQ
ncbi:MAG: hypothetical protein LBF04_00955 [Prevotellaceae bacterium]|jgi:hypothetical protein|nr:hypothetical protein [Prevotellaceae bacterium]